MARTKGTSNRKRVGVELSEVRRGAARRRVGAAERPARVRYVRYECPTCGQGVKVPEFVEVVSLTCDGGDKHRKVAMKKG